MSKNIQSQYFDFEVHLLGIAIFHKFEIFQNLMCREEMSFGSCSAWGNGGQMAHFGGRCGWEGLGARGNFANE